MKKAISTLQKIQVAFGGLFLFIFLVTVAWQMLARYMGILLIAVMRWLDVSAVDWLIQTYWYL